MKQFPPFRLDTANQCLWRQVAGAEDRRIALAPKAFGVLNYLVEHAPRLVTHRELLEAVWPTSSVQPEVLSSHIRDLRAVMGDDSRKPRFIETLARRGYRFIATVTDGRSAESDRKEGDGEGRLVGRASVLAALDQLLDATLAGKRQIVFVTGEPGIGKTAVADEFQRRVRARLPTLRFARGQGIEGYGGHEAYYPILKAVGELCRGPGGASIVRTLATQAPTWLFQFPALLEQAGRDLLQRDIVGATPARMLREISEALETITAEVPLLMVLEDLHWVDLSTLDFISEIARRRDFAKFMLVVTYRPLDAALATHPLQSLKQDLRVRQLCHEIALNPLEEVDIETYLGGGTVDAGTRRHLSKVLYQHSEGNPLFMVAALQEMTERGLVSKRDGEWAALVSLEEIHIQVPESLRQMIEAQIERLSQDEQRALEVAAVTHTLFSSAVCAAAAGMAPEEFENICEPLARRERIIRAIRPREFPDGTFSPSYEFVHVLYREVLNKRQTPGLLSARHRRVGEAIELLWGRHVREVAAELAEHFERAHDWSRTLKYLRVVAETAQHRFAHRETEALLRRALELVNRIPPPERPLVETDLLEQLASTYAASSDSRCIETYEALVGRTAHYGLLELEIRALTDLAYCLSWISAARALEILQKAMTLSDELSDEVLRAGMRMNCLVGRVWVGGWNFQDAQAARDALATIRSAGDRHLLAPHLIGYSQIQWISSEYREAYHYAVEGLDILAEREGENPYLSIPFQRGATVRPRSLLFLGEWGRALREIDTAITVADKNGDNLPAQVLRLNRAWIRLEAMDFAGVRESCDQVARSVGHFASGYLLRFSQILSGAADLALGESVLAFEKLSAARQGMESQAILSDWYFRMPLELHLTELWLSQDNLSAARQAVDRLLSAALLTEEHTWRGLAWEASARVAAAENDFDRARICVESALATIEGREAPLAAWRVRATAAEIYSHWGESGRATQQLEMSWEVLRRLTDSLAEDESLRMKFLAAPRVAKVASRFILSPDGIPES